jgi:hypothetical protein
MLVVAILITDNGLQICRFDLLSGWDKSNHLLAFAVLAWLGGVAWIAGQARNDNFEGPQ